LEGRLEVMSELRQCSAGAADHTRSSCNRPFDCVSESTDEAFSALVSESEAVSSSPGSPLVGPAAPQALPDTPVLEPTLPPSLQIQCGNGRQTDDTDDFLLDGVVPVLRVRRTFVEYHMAPPQLRRAHTTPELSRFTENVSSHPSECHREPDCSSYRMSSVRESIGTEVSLGGLVEHRHMGLGDTSYTADMSTWDFSTSCNQQLHGGVQMDVRMIEPMKDQMMGFPIAEMYAGLEGMGHQHGNGRRSPPKPDPEQAFRLLCQNSSEDVWTLVNRDGAGSATAQLAIKMAAAEIHAAQWQGKAVCEAALARTEALLLPFRGRVLEALGHRHANYAIAVMLEVMPIEQVMFVPRELIGHGHSVARHRYGCRSILRLVPHCIACWEAKKVLDEVVGHAMELSKDRFANYVIREVIDHGMEEHRNQVVESLSKDLKKAATHRHGSHNVEKALQKCCQRVTQGIAEKLMCSNDSVINLIDNEFGMPVVKALLGNQEHQPWVEKKILDLQSSVVKSRHGKRLIQWMQDRSHQKGSDAISSRSTANQGRGQNGHCRNSNNHGKHLRSETSK